MQKVLFVYEDEDLKPFKKYKTDQGWDLKQKEDVVIGPKMYKVIGTGVRTKISKGYYGQILPRSSLQLNNGVMIMGGVIDSEYRDEIKVIVYNQGSQPLKINKGDRICQLVVIKVQLDQDFEHIENVKTSFFKTKRGKNGFGSTGK